MGKLFASLLKPSSSPGRARGKETAAAAAAAAAAGTSQQQQQQQHLPDASTFSDAPPATTMSDSFGDQQLESAAALEEFEIGAAAAECPFSARQLKKLRDAFDFFDINNDGRISCGELRKVLRFLGSRVSEQEAQRIIADVDMNCNGTVEFNEFVAMMSAYHRKSQREGERPPQTAEEAEILEAFQAFDHNGDNYIDFTELKKTMQFLGERVTDTDIDCMIREADIDLDGRIDFDEFKKLLATVKRRL